MANSAKIVIADDMEPILLYLEKVISNVPEFEIVGKAKNGNELIELVTKYKPELVITDVEMPECNGIQAIEHLNELGIKTKYVLVTGNDNLIVTNNLNQIGVVKTIKKPIIDDNKLISQIRNAVNLEVVNTKVESHIKENIRTKMSSCKKREYN